MEKQLASLNLEDDESDGVYEISADVDGDIDLDDEFIDDDDDDLDVEDRQDSFPTILPAENPPPYYPGILTCIVCQERPPYCKNGKSYPTCGLKCASILEEALGTVGSSSSTPGNAVAGPSTPRGSLIRTPQKSAPVVTSPVMYAPPSSAVADSTPNQPSRYRSVPQFTTIAPPVVSTDSNFKHLSQHLGGHPMTPRRGRNVFNHHNTPTRRVNTVNINTGDTGSTAIVVQDSPTLPRAPVVKCVICLVKPCRDSKYVTCGLTCAEKLCKNGSNPKNCDYCHRRPKVAGHNQCGDTCRNSAKVACLLCKCRPKYKRYHLCGKTCKQIAIKSTPLILEAPAGHTTFEMVEKKFKSSWRVTSSPCPPVKKIYKIIENKSFLQPYDRYKKAIGNEVFCYHGTTKKCTLGVAGNTQLCTNTSCSLCSILRTSFKTELANPGGAFGAGVYSSSASNKAFSYTSSGSGAILLSKVVLGNVRQVNAWNEVMSCPPGCNSVVFDRQNGSLNETIVYTNDAIRPVFLLIF